MTHYVYEIRNQLNSKSYIGVRMITDPDMVNDGYMGSGTAIRRAVAHYGAENFTKRILCIADRDYAYWLESKLVDAAYVARRDTYNLRTGGGLSQEDIERVRATMTGRERTAEHRKNLSISLTGNSPSEKTREKLRQINLGKKQSEESKRKRSQSLMGIKRPKSTEHRRKISAALMGQTSPRKGVCLTEETKQKLREANLGKKQSAATIAKKAAALTGYKHKQVTCPNCGKTGGITGMKCWHFDNCKSLNAAGG